MRNLDTTNMRGDVFPTEPVTVQFSLYDNPTNPSSVAVDIPCVDWTATNSSATVSWGPSTNGGLSATVFYVVTATADGVVITHTPVVDLTVTFTTLTPGKNYTFSVYATQVINGCTADSETVYVYGNTEQTSSMVTQFTVVYKNDGYSLLNSPVAQPGIQFNANVLSELVITAATPVTPSAPSNSVYELITTNSNGTGITTYGSGNNFNIEHLMGVVGNYTFKIGSHIVDDPDCIGQYTAEIIMTKYEVPSEVRNINFTYNFFPLGALVVNWDLPIICVGDITYEVWVNDIFKQSTSSTTYSITSPEFDTSYNVIIRPYRSVTIDGVTKAYLGEQATAVGYYRTTPIITLSSNINESNINNSTIGHNITIEPNGVILATYKLRMSSITGTKSDTLDNLVYNDSIVILTGDITTNNLTLQNVVSSYGKYTFTIEVVWKDPNTYVESSTGAIAQTVIYSYSPEVVLKSNIDNSLTFTINNNWSDVTSYLVFIVPADYLTDGLPNTDLLRQGTITTIQIINNTTTYITTFDVNISFDTNNILKYMGIVSNANGMGYITN
jgi:hypothetical protein